MDFKEKEKKDEKLGSGMDLKEKDKNLTFNKKAKTVCPLKLNFFIFCRRQYCHKSESSFLFAKYSDKI